jgi:hypothetical protein
MQKHTSLSTRIAAATGAAAMMVAALASQALAATPAPGLLVKNYWGAPATIDIADAEYTVPAGGQLFIALAPGEYDLSANVDGADNSAENAQVDIPANQEVQMSYAASGVFFAPVNAPQSAAQPPATQPAPSSPASSQPAITPAAKTGLLVKNYWNGNATLNIADTEYTVPANGQLLVALAPGDYDLSVNVDGADNSADTASFTVAANQEMQMSYASSGVFFAPVTTAPAASTQPAANQPAVTSSSVQPSSSPVQPMTAPTSKTGVLVKNYFGEALTFNVADTEYSVPADGQMFIALAPGQYTYSASVASTDAGTRSDMLTIMAGQTVTIADY